MKHEIEIEVLPEGWEAVAFRVPEPGEYFFIDGNVEFSVIASLPYLIVKKKQPRRIVLEETGDIRLVRPGEHYGYVEDNIYIGMWPAPNNSIHRYRIWREVKEPAPSLHNADDKESLRLSREQCRELLNFSSSAIEMIRDFLRSKP